MLQIARTQFILNALKNSVSLGYLLSIILVLPDLVWISLDRSIWPWDPAWYGRASIELFYKLIYSPTDWPAAMVEVLKYQAPGIAWFGQFFVPVGQLIGSFDIGLLFFVILTRALGLLLIYRVILELSKGKLLAATLGCLIIATAPLGVGLAHQYYIETLQTLMVIWFILIMSFAPRWSRAFTISQLIMASVFAVLVKVSSPIYCLGPGLVTLGYVLFSKRPPSWGWFEARTLISVTVNVPFVLGTAVWYSLNLEQVRYYVSIYSSGQFADLYGQRGSFLEGMIYWFTALQQSFFFPIMFVVVLAIIMGGIIAHFNQPQVKIDDFLLSVAVAIFQVMLLLSIFSLNINREVRFILPLLPYLALLVSWSATQINKFFIIHLVIFGSVIQFIAVYGQAFGVLSPSPVISYHLHPFHSDTSKVSLLNSIVFKTCTRANMSHYWNIIGDQKPWLNANTMNYIAAKQLIPSDQLSCSYENLGYAESNLNNAWDRVMAYKAVYYITSNPELYPIAPNKHDQTLNQLNIPMLQKIRESGLFEPEPTLSKVPEVLIFRRKEGDPQLSFGNFVMLTQHNFHGELHPDYLQLWLVLKWQALQSLTQPYYVNLRVVTANGTILIERNFQPAAKTAPQPGDIITTEFEIEATTDNSQLTTSHLEIRILDNTQQVVPLQTGDEALIIPNLQDQVQWRITPQ